MKTDYWYGVDAALQGELHNFEEKRDYYSDGFIEGYMSVLRGEQVGWGKVRIRKKR